MSSRSGFRPKQTLGQNFLVDENVARKIVELINPQPDDIIIEIGPGFGAISKFLTEGTEQVIAIEIDRRLAGHLQNSFTSYDNFKLIHADFLKTDLMEISQGRAIRVVGNIPYHITSPVIFKIFESSAEITDLTLMIQREVAERIVAQPRTKAYGILSVMSRLYSQPELLFHVSRNVFKPKPDVASTLIRWDLSKAPNLMIEDKELLRTVIRATFNQRRKMLRKSLQQLECFLLKREKIDFDLERRPEELTIEEFVELTNQLV